MKKQNGITLIALIITIIVMLILVGVTINVALNGGLIEKAKTAQEQTSREVSREQIVAAMIGAYDNNGNFVKANVELPEGVKWCKKGETYANATNNSGECNYVITEKGEIFYVLPTDGTVLDDEPVVEELEDVYYDITFKSFSDLSQIDWSKTTIEIGTYYFIALQNDTNKISAISFFGNDYSHMNVGYIPDLANNPFEQYVLDSVSGGSWSHFPDTRTGKPDSTGGSNPEIKKVKIITDETLYSSNNLISGLEYMDLITNKTISQ